MEDGKKKLDKELCFLIAKYLCDTFPDLAKTFIEECEKHQMFPSSVFSTSPSFNQLCHNILPSIPNDQLMRLLMHEQPTQSQPNYGHLITNCFLCPTLKQDIPIKNEFCDFKPTLRILGHNFIVYCIVFDKTSQLMITGSDDSVVKVWKFPEVTLIASLTEHKGVISEIVIHPSNLYIGSVSDDGVVCIHSLLTDECKKCLKFEGSVFSIRFSSDGKYLALSTNNGVLLYNFESFVNTQKITNLCTSKKEKAWMIEFTPASNFIVYVNDFNKVLVYNIKNSSFQTLFSSNYGIYSISLKRNPPYILIIVFYKLNYFSLLYGADKLFEKTTSIDVGEKIKQVKWNCNETSIIVLKKKGIDVYTADSFKLIKTIHNEKFLTKTKEIVPHPLKPFVVFVGTKNGICSIWDIRNKTILTSFDLYRGITVSEWSPDGQFLIVSDDCFGFSKICVSPSDTVYQTEHQFHLIELSKDIADKDNRMIVDCEGNPLVPQPKKWEINQIRLLIRDIPPSPYCIRYENEILKKQSNPNP